MAAHPRFPVRRGISLLEVLISIGIISIGLLATFSLIPAGRSYMQKAAIDDRAAALVPAAFETIETRGLLKTTALSWEDVPDGTFNDPEWSNDPLSRAVIREQSGRDVTDPSPSAYPGNSGQTRDELWTIDTIDTETIDTRYDRDPPPAKLTGMVNPPAIRTVTISSSPASGPDGTAVSQANGSWEFPIPSGLLAPDMLITTSGPGVGTVSNMPYTDYTFTATYTDDMGTPQTSATTPGSPYRHYGRRRQIDLRTGYAFLEYTRPGNATESNQDPTEASAIPNFRMLDNASGARRNAVAKSVQKTVTGSLWRMTLGTVRNSYTQYVDFANTNNAPPQPRTPSCQNCDIAIDAGTFVSGSTQIDDEVDWYRFPVRAAEIVKIKNISSSTGDLAKDPETNTRYFPAYFNDVVSGTMSPLPGFADADYYFIPQDGTVLVRAALSPAARNTIYGVNKPRYDNNGPQRSNPSYAIEISRLPSERAVVVDPIAATRLDRALINADTPENRLRRQRFADYEQVYAGSGRTQRRIIPRLNWSRLAETIRPTPADSAVAVDAAIAAADLLFRDNDSLLIDTSGTFANADGAPGPLFDVAPDITAADPAQSPVPVRRQSAGKMSWLMMLQPEDAGPVAVNWTAGKWFDVSIVVFEDRPLPAVTGGPYTGEYAQLGVSAQKPLTGVWSDLDGTLTVAIPANGDNDITDDDEIRRLFRTGAWILLAPRVIDPNESPLANTTRMDWVRVQSARVGASNGVRGVKLLLESEPNEKTLNRDKQTTAPNFQVVVLAYDGVVSVVNRSVQLE